METNPLCVLLCSVQSTVDVVVVMVCVHSHVGPSCNAALVDAVWQVDQLTVVVLKAVCTEGLVHTLTGTEWHGQAAVEGQQAQQKDTQ